MILLCVTRRGAGAIVTPWGGDSAVCAEAPFREGRGRTAFRNEGAAADPRNRARPGRSAGPALLYFSIFTV